MSGSSTALTTIAPTIDGTGVHVPTFEQILQYFQNGFQQIYGSDIYLENDSQDGPAYRRPDESRS